MEMSAVRLFVDDLSAVQGFYAGQLGLPLTAGRPEWGFLVFRAGAVDLVVESVAADAPHDERVLVGRFTGVSFKVADIQVRYDELSAAGVRFDEPPERQAWGGMLATFRDPGGNSLQLVQLPA